MREINCLKITEAVKELVITAARDLEPDILDALFAARDREKSPLAKDVVEILLANANIASRDQIPVCQDTGIAVVFVEIGQDVHVTGNLQGAIQEGVRAGYDEGYLRKSVCDPLTRKNTGTNTPAVVHVEISTGDHLRLAFLPKGCGSENMSGLAMLPPSAGTEGIVRYVVDQVLAAGSNPCPPVIVGVGIGGTFEQAPLLAKKSLLRPVGDHSARKDVAELEQRILAEINQAGQGVHGLGGSNTALAVHIELFPSHIASLPVAVNIQCHAHRHKETTL
ncbi:MAG: fumarate hydratase [Proteobacteria bacterium]|nr:fumarate hydratase [Pseudomonadota bacterium]MBU1714614.1 fumarate hydratase [Pseudomonadota bacterium]